LKITRGRISQEYAYTDYKYREEVKTTEGKKEADLWRRKAKTIDRLSPKGREGKEEKWDYEYVVRCIPRGSCPMTPSKNGESTERWKRSKEEGNWRGRMADGAAQKSK